MGALTIAGHYTLPEVTIFFNKKLFRGNRCKKIDLNKFDTFTCPNYPPLATLDVDFEINWDLILNQNEEEFSIFTEMDSNISTFRIQPCLNIKMAEALFLGSKAVIIETYGMGNIPWKNQQFLELVIKALNQGVIIVMTSQS